MLNPLFLHFGSKAFDRMDVLSPSAVLQRGMLSVCFADTQFLAANRLTEEKWSKTAFEYMLQNMQLSAFMGTDGNSIIQVNKDLSVAAGKQVTMRLRAPLSGEGNGDDGDIEGNEEPLNFFNFLVEVHERSHGVRAKGVMTQQYTSIDIIREATEALMGDWAPERLENDLVYALCGLGNAGTYAGEGTSDIKTVNEHAPSANRILYGGQTNAGVATFETSVSLIGDGGATDYQNFLFGTKVIDRMKMRALLAAPKFRPVKINGKGYYVIFIHPLQGMDLQYDTNWNTTQQQANVRGLLNPLFGKTGMSNEMERMFSGVKGIWNDVIIYELERLPTRIAGESFENPNTATNIVHTNIASGTARICRAVLCGAQAGCLAWAKTWQKHMKDFDYGRKPGVAVDGVYGVSKTLWNDPGIDQDTNTAQEDFAVVVADTAATER